MDPSSVYACKKWLTVLGAFLMLFPSGFPWYWGNMSIYVLSYVHNRMPSSSSVEAPWIISFIIIGGCIGTLTSGVMVRFLGKRLTTVSGIIVFTSAWLGWYVSVQRSMTAVNLVSLVMSLGEYLMDETAILYALEWCQEDVGVVSAFIHCGFTAGAIFINQFVTFYINPKNLLPDQHDGPSKFFSQDDVLDKVPSMFLVMAIISLAINITALIMIREKPEIRPIRVNQAFLRFNNSYGAVKSRRQIYHSKNRKSIVIVESLETAYAPSASAIGQTRDKSPTEVVRTSILYYYWFFFVMAEVPYMVVTNYYKSYGQLYIHNDHFLTNLSTALLVVITLSRTFWGLMLDRCGLKNSFILYFSGCALTGVFFYFSPLIHKWCYVVTTLVFGCFGNCLYVFFTYAAVKSFGKRYFIFNFGIIMIPSFLANFLLPPLLQYLLVQWGWFYLFAFSSCFATFGLIVAILAMDETNGI